MNRILLHLHNRLCLFVAKQIAAAYPFAQIPKRSWTSSAHLAQASCQFVLENVRNRFGILSG
jgi:hypothetical protein